MLIVLNHTELIFGALAVFLPITGLAVIALIVKMTKPPVR